MADTSPFPPPLALAATDWGMPGPVGAELGLPVDNVFLHHTVTAVTDRPIEDALDVAMIGIARFGLVSYSVLVHPARVIFWAQTEHRGAHTRGWNSRAVGLALIGDYQRRDMPDSMVYDACVALHALRSFGVVSARPTVRPHQQVSATACPGRHAIASVLPFLRAVAAEPNWRP